MKPGQLGNHPVPPRAVREDVSEERRGAAHCLWLDPRYRWGDEWKAA